MPFAGYDDFAACERANSDKRSPGAYCAAIKRATEQGVSHDDLEIQALGDVSDDLGTAITEEESPCWDGYVMVGTKTVDGREVPNCVPEEDAEPMEEQARDEATQQAVATSVLEQQLDALAHSECSPWIRESSEQGIAWVDPTAGAVIYEQDSYTDYPEAAKENAQQALDWREEYGRDEVTAGTRTGWIRANQLADGEALSRETVGRMAAFRRHEDNAEIDAEHEGTPWKDDGYVAWLLWGGDEGVSWAERQLEQEDTSEQEANEYSQLTFDKRKQAEAVADLLGCSGSHEGDGGFMPCESHGQLLSVMDDDTDETQSVVVKGLSQEAREYIESTYDVEVTEHE